MPIHFVYLYMYMYSAYCIRMNVHTYTYMKLTDELDEHEAGSEAQHAQQPRLIAAHAATQPGSHITAPLVLGFMQSL